MARWRIEYYAERRFSPLSWWVHHNEDSEEWRQAQAHTPPFPHRDGLKGFPYLWVQVDGYELEFASSHEIRHCIDILRQRHLPHTKDLTCSMGTTYQGHNHWLAIYPAKLKSWSKRQKTVKVLTLTLQELFAAGIDF